jgi:type IV pilus biogenesis protein CpaD/CtpE
MQALRVAAVSMVALSAGCGRRPAAPLEQAVAPPDTAHSIVFKEVKGKIDGINSKQACPVTAHFDATLTLSRIGGTLRYRWERSTGANGPVLELSIPAGAQLETVDLSVKPDEWPLNQPGQQLTVKDRIHVLAPVDALSPSLSLNAMCY